MSKRLRKIRRQNIIQLLAGIAIIVLLNIIASYVFTRIDLTSEKRYTLSESTKELLDNLENLGDKMRDDMLGELFEKHAKDPLAVIKWKDIYQDAETVLDVCEDVVHVIESILVKHA